MKKTRTPHAARLCFVILLTAFGSVAAADELDANLLWAYRYLLASAHTERELAPIAERITWHELPNTELSDIAAEVLLSRLEGPAFPVDNQGRLVNLLALYPVIAAAETDATDAITWTFEYLLATAQTERELAPVTDHIVRDELPYPLLTDFAAEVLLSRAKDASYPEQNKIRLVRILDAARSRRYEAVLASVIAQAPEAEVVNWARSAKIRWIREHDDAYVPGTIDIHEIVRSVGAAASAVRPTSAQGRHLAEFQGGTIEELFKWAGRPHRILSNQTIYRDPLFKFKGDRIAFYYRGLGRVLYSYNRMQGDWIFAGLVADPLAFEDAFGPPDAPTLAMIQLVSGFTAAMKNAVETSHRRKVPTLEFMDTAAEILVTQFESSDDPAVIDVYAWMCRMLTRHGGVRYSAVLQRVATETPDAKLRKFARLQIAAAAGVPADPYVPGSISLDAQRAKYPSPYPESTFQAGRL
jgi:hypothetical protein